jgi:hypothetical protein
MNPSTASSIAALLTELLRFKDVQSTALIRSNDRITKLLAAAQREQGPNTVISMALVGHGETRKCAPPTRNPHRKRAQPSDDKQPVPAAPVLTLSTLPAKQRRVDNAATNVAPPSTTRPLLDSDEE